MTNGRWRYRRSPLLSYLPRGAFGFRTSSFVILWSFVIPSFVISSVIRHFPATDGKWRRRSGVALWPRSIAAGRRPLFQVPRKRSCAANTSSREPLARANLVAKLLLRHRIVRLAIIRPHARARPHELAYERNGYNTVGHILRETDYRFSKLRRPLLQVELRLTRRCPLALRLTRRLRHSCFVICHSFVIPSFVIRHSTNSVSRSPASSKTWTEISLFKRSRRRSSWACRSCSALLGGSGYLRKNAWIS